jgi:hypothetical protein
MGDRGFRTVAIDWSGRASGEARHLWMAEVDRNGRADALVGRSRVEVADRLLTLADADPALIVGLDFGFSLPAWFLQAHGIGAVDELWSDTDRLERWLRTCDPPFWGRPGRRRPVGPGDEDRQWRLTELAAAAIGPRPKSVFQVGGAGAVGTGSLRGMPMLHRLRAAGFAVWPFDPPVPPVLLEVWPRHHYAAPLIKSDSVARAAATSTLPEPWRAQAAASEDAFDAAVTAVGLAARTAEVPAAVAPADPVVGYEGWIWGVPPLSSP